MPFDPSLRKETRLLQELYRDNVTGKPVYRMMEFCLVQYGDDPDRYVEMLPINDAVDNFVPDPLVDGMGQIAGFETFNSNPYEFGNRSADEFP